MKPESLKSFAWVVCLALPLAIPLACGGSKPPPPVEPANTETVSDAGVEDAAPPAPKSLFERIGKREGVDKIAKSMGENLKANKQPLGKAYGKLAKAKQEAFEKAFAEQFCDMVGGQCGYAGKSLKEVFKGWKITEKDWEELVKELGGSLVENKVEDAEKTDVLDVFGKAKEDVVEAPPAAKGGKKK
jgi:hemoglobin